MVRVLLPTLLLFGCQDGDSILSSGLYFVKLDTEGAKVAQTAASLANTFQMEVVHTYDNATEGFTARIPHVFVDEVRDLNNVEGVYKDEERSIIIPDEASDIQLGKTETPEGLLRIGAPYTGSLGTIHVAVIDTGVDDSHSDLNVVAEADIVGERNGDWANGGDPNGHGTHVAGTIGALANKDGVVGVAPGVPIHAVRVLDGDGAGTYGDIVAGLEYVLDNPEIQVVNMSLGGPSSTAVNAMLSEPLERLEEAGVIVCIAAGNETQDTSGVSPAGLDLGIVVSAYDSVGGDNGFAWFSNYGDAVDIAAPGVDILSTWPGGGYQGLSGTSMATPHVAGVMAVYRALAPNTTVQQARNAVINTGESGLSGATGDHPEPMIDLEALLGAI